jgi:heme exporter protein D
MSYVTAAYAVTFGLIGLYTASVIARGRSARREAAARAREAAAEARASATPTDATGE